MEFMLFLLHSKNDHWLCTRCTIVVVAIEAVVVQWRVTHGVKAGAVLVRSASCYMFGNKGQFKSCLHLRGIPHIWYTVSTLDCFTIRTAWDASTATDVPTHTGLVSPDTIQWFGGSCEVFLVSRFCCHLQPSTQTRSSQIAVSPGPKVAPSPSQSESKKQPHMWSFPLESIGPAPQRGRSNGQFASLEQPFKAILDRGYFLVCLPDRQAGPSHQKQLS